MNDNRMTTDERRATWGLGAVFSLRMLGMFMVLPVLTTYGMALQGATQALIGIAIACFALCLLASVSAGIVDSVCALILF